MSPTTFFDRCWLWILTRLGLIEIERLCPICGNTAGCSCREGY